MNRAPTSLGATGLARLRLAQHAAPLHEDSRRVRLAVFNAGFYVGVGSSD
jgi:hypothetical protein